MKRKAFAVIVFLFLGTLLCVHHPSWSNATPSPCPTPGQIITGPVHDAQIAEYREKYLKTADSYLQARNHKSACITYQKLLDILFKKSVESNFDVWMSAYGSLYKQADMKLKKTLSLYQEERRKTLAAFCARKEKERLSPSPYIPVIKKRVPLRVKGDLSPDGALVIAAFNTESPPINSNHIIGVYLAESGEKIYDEMPIPDDRNNPQINRWGRAYVMQDPVWSPDGLCYAYSINGALCVSNDGSGKPVLISGIPDRDEVHDHLLGWAPDGKKLVYIRNENESRVIYWNTSRGEKEHRVMAGEKACFSEDSSRLVIISGGKAWHSVLKTGKTEQLGNADECALSPDNRMIVLQKKSRIPGSISMVGREGTRGVEKELFSTGSSFFKGYEAPLFNSAMFLAPDLIAFNVTWKKGSRRVGDVWCYSLSLKKGAPVTFDGTSALSPWLSTPKILATRKELLHLSR